MLMNSLDVFMQRNSLYGRYRKWWIERVVTSYLLRFIDLLAGKRVLEIGCGSGYGAQVIKRFCDSASVTATDLDPRLISKARERTVGQTILFDVADATCLPYPDEHYDAVFDFAAIHHIPEWKECLSELRRIVKSGGHVFLVDSPIESFSSFLGRLSRIYTSHPYDAMFSEIEFVSYLRELDFKILVHDVFRPNLYYFVMVVEK